MLRPLAVTCTPCSPIRLRCLSNCLDRPFKEIWAGGPLLGRLRNLKFSDYTQCHTGCAVSEYCTPCAGLMMMNKGTIEEGEDQLCANTENLVALGRTR